MAVHFSLGRSPGEAQGLCLDSTLPRPMGRIPVSNTGRGHTVTNLPHPRKLGIPVSPHQGQRPKAGRIWGFAQASGTRGRDVTLQSGVAGAPRYTCKGVLHHPVMGDKGRGSRSHATENLENKLQSKRTLITWVDPYVLTESGSKYS